MEEEEETSLEVSLRFVIFLNGKVATKTLGLFLVEK
jgi:hypothetical protein